MSRQVSRGSVGEYQEDEQARVARLSWRVSSLFTFHLHALEKEMATHSSTLAWRIPWTEEPGGLQSMGSQRVRHAEVIKLPPAAKY